MNRKNRFLIPSYLINTIKIKLLANWKKATREAYPYDYFKDKVADTWDGNYSLKYSDEYKSLTYFDFEEAKDFHKDNSSVTVDLIKALVYHNSRASLEAKVELLGMAEDILDEALETETQLSFIFNEPYARFNLSGSHLSAIVQGKAASLFIRCYQKTEDDQWLKLARKALNHFGLFVADGGILIRLPNNMEWMEEYPSPKPSMVLNGYLFWLIGLGEYCAIAHDKEFIQHFERQMRSAMNWLPAYKLSGGLLYSMYRWDHCNVHYTAIMKYQFEHLYQLTNIGLFKEYADHCDEHTNWNVFKQLIGKNRNED